MGRLTRQQVLLDRSANVPCAFESPIRLVSWYRDLKRGYADAAGERIGPSSTVKIIIFALLFSPEPDEIFFVIGTAGSGDALVHGAGTVSWPMHGAHRCL